MEYKPTQEQFDKETADHRIDIQLDDGLFRHIVCTNNGSMVYRFNITTWPGYLCISGDMGCFVFSRTADMFTFFVSGNRDDGHINPGYWGEKLQERGDFYKKYSSDTFEKRVREMLENHLEFEDDEKLCASRRGELDDFFKYEDTTFEVEARRGIDELDNPAFSDLWEEDFTEYTHHYIWCLRAIVWAIQRYNMIKADVRVAA